MKKYIAEFLLLILNYITTESLPYHMPLKLMVLLSEAQEYSYVTHLLKVCCWLHYALCSGVSG